MRERTQSLHIGQSVGSFVRRPQLSGAQTEHGFVSNEFHVHLVSDATGETLNAIARATTVQFEHAEIVYHRWSLIRTRFQLHRVMEGGVAVDAEPARFDVG